MDAKTTHSLSLRSLATNLSDAQYARAYNAAYSEGHSHGWDCVKYELEDLLVEIASKGFEAAMEEVE